VAQRLDLDPGVLCAKDRIEAVARRNPETMEEMEEVTELRRWQAGVLGEEYLTALIPHRGKKGEPELSTDPVPNDDSPYLD